jgi:pilus assembly protein CpaD
MTKTKRIHSRSRLAAAALVSIALTALTGCSQDFSSVDDVYVPRTGQDRFPIQVVDMPVKMSIPAGSGKLPAEAVNRLSSFARLAAQDRETPVSVTYPNGSVKARNVSQQAVRILVHQGIPRSMIHQTSYKGKSDVVTLSFSRTVAATKECGDWSRNVGNDPKNEPYPNYGCSLQTNFAAMADDPRDFERPRREIPDQASGKTSAMRRYQDGTWTTPPARIDIGQ